MNILKKLAIAFGVLVGLLLVAVIVIPFVVDVDKYRPQIVSAANEHINGKLELGKLKLSLWGQIRIEIAAMSLKDAKSQPVVNVQDAYFHLPFMSVLSGSPELVLNISKPFINVTKDNTGKMNVMTLVKEKPVDAAAQLPAGTGGSAAPASPMTLPPIAARARLSVEIHNALVSYKDASGPELMSTEIKDMNVTIKDISLSRPMEMELSAEMDSKIGKSIIVKGPARMKARAQPFLANNQLERLTASAKIDLNDLEILMPGLFEKKKGMEANADFAMTMAGKEATIEHFNAKFFNAEITSKGKVSNIEGEAPIVDYELRSNSIDLKPWSQLIPMLKDYELAGTATLEAMVNGPSAKLNYKAKMAVKSLTAKAPNLKTQPQFDAAISVVTDQIDSMTLTMKAPGNDLSIKGRLVSFTTPKGDFEVTSNGMDLDQLIEFPQKAKADAANTPASPAPGAPAAAAPVANYDAMLDPLRKNLMAAASTINIGVNMKQIKAYGVAMTDINSKMTFRDLVASVDSFSMKLFGGTIKASMAANLKPAAPTYKFGASVDALDLNQAVASQMNLFKNTIVGKMNYSMNGTGSSFNPDPAIQNLNSKGSFKVNNAVLRTIDVGKMAMEALNGALDRIGDKYPQAKGKKVGTPSNREQRFDYISSDFMIAGGKFSAPNFVAKAEANKGIDLNGNTTVGMKDYSVAARWQLVDTYNVTKAADISIDQLGTKVDRILAEGNGPVKFPVSVGCTLLAPCYSYTEVPEYLAKVAVGKITGAVEGKAKAELQKRAQEALKKAPPAVQDKVNDIRKKFGI